MKYVLILSLIFFNSCVMIKQSETPVGKEITKLDSKEWDGLWLNNENLLYVKVIDGKKGKALCFTTEYMPFFSEFRQSGTDHYINFPNKSRKDSELKTTTSQNYTYANNGERLVLLKDINDVLLKEEFTGRKVKVFKGHKAQVVATSFSLDRSKIIAASNSNILIWDSVSGKQLQNFKNLFNNLLYVAFSPDSKSFAEAYSRFIILRATKTGKRIRTIKADFKKGNFLLYNSTGKKLRQFEQGFYGKAVKVWDTATGKEIRLSLLDLRKKPKEPLEEMKPYSYIKYKKTDKVEIYNDKGKLSDISFVKVFNKPQGPVSEKPREPVSGNLREKKIVILGKKLSLGELATFKEGFKLSLKDENSFISKRDTLLALQIIEALEEYEKAKKNNAPNKKLDKYLQDILKLEKESAKKYFEGPHVLTLKRENNQSSFYLHPAGENPLYLDNKQFKYSLEKDTDFEIKLESAVDIKTVEAIKGFFKKHSPKSLRISFSNPSFRKLVFEKDPLKAFDLLFGKQQLYSLISSEKVKKTPLLKSKLLYKNLLRKLLVSFKGADQKDLKVNNILAFSPDNNKVMIKTEGNIRIIQADSGKILGSIKSNNQIKGAAFSPDGQSFTVGFKDGLSGLWKTDGELIKKERYLDFRSILAVSSDYRKIMVETGDRIRIIQTDSGKELGSIKILDRKISSVQFSADGEKFSIGFKNGSILVWKVSGELITELKELDGDKLELVIALYEFLPYLSPSIKRGLNILGHNGNILKCRFSPKADHIISYAEDNALKFWDLKSGKLIKTFDCLIGSHPVSVMGSERSPGIKISVNADCDRIVSLDNKSEPFTQVKLWDLNTEKIIHVFQYESKLKAVSMSFSPSGKTVNVLGDNELTVWDTETGKLLESKRINKNFINTDEGVIIQNSSGRYELTDSNNGSLDRFKKSNCEPLILNWSVLSNGKLQPSNESKTFIFKFNLIEKSVVLAENIVFSQSRKYLCGVEKEDLVSIYRIDGSLFTDMARPLTDFHQFELSPNEQWLVSLKESSKTVEITSFGSKIKHSLKGHKYAIKSFQISPNGKLIATAGKDGEIIIWNLENGTRIQSVNGQLNHISINFTEEGKYMFSSNNKGIEIWDLKLKSLGLVSFSK